MKTAAQIHAVLAAMSMITNPELDAPYNQMPKNTVRSPSVILADKAKAKGLFADFRAAVLTETGKTYPLDGKLWQDFQYRIAHYIMEEGDAVLKGNQ